MTPMQLLQKAKEDEQREIEICDEEIERYRVMWVEGETQYKEWVKAREKAIWQRDAYDNAMNLLVHANSGRGPYVSA